MTLFPAGLEIRTIGDQISDKIALRGIGGSIPAETVDASLQTLLKKLVGTP